MNSFGLLWHFAYWLDWKKRFPFMYLETRSEISSTLWNNVTIKTSANTQFNSYLYKWTSKNWGALKFEEFSLLLFIVIFSKRHSDFIKRIIDEPDYTSCNMN